jgi:uncharacterized membrane protein
MQNTKNMNSIILIAAITATALIAGLFYAYICSVNIGLGRLPDREYLAAMQNINSAILNPLFFLSFMGTLILIPLSAWLNYEQSLSGRFLLLAIAAVVYIIGVFGVTMLGNVPLNDMLAGADLKIATASNIARLRLSFEQPWLMWHNVRTIASVICLLLAVISGTYRFGHN